MAAWGLGFQLGEGLGVEGEGYSGLFALNPKP